jgi:RND superfamily putative drug exporter
VVARLARWCFKHRIIVVVAWLVVLFSVIGAERAVGSSFSNSFSLPGTESSRALELLNSAFPQQAGESGTIVWRTTDGSVSDPEVKATMQSLLGQVATAPSVTLVISPYDAIGASQVSADGKTGYATVMFAGRGQDLPKEDVLHVGDLVKAASTTDLQIHLGGDAAQAANEVSLSSSAAIGLVAAGVIILLAFGSFLGMLLPLITAGVALGLTVFGINLLSHGVAINSVAPTMAIVVGLGVGIDYALFVVTRHRQGLKSGMAPEEAAVQALNTAGRAVLFAGATVCVALLGLLIVRLNLLDGLAYSSVFAVALTMVAAVTLLPAMLGFMGMRVLTRRERRRLTEKGPHEGHASGFWARLGGYVSRRPAILAVVATLLMVFLAGPFLSLRLGLSDAGNDPASSSTRKAYDLLAEGFGPGFNGPLLLVAEKSSEADAAALERLTQTLQSEPGVAAVVPYPSAAGAGVAIVAVVPTTSPQDARTGDLIAHLRSDVIPAAEQGSGLQVLVGGATAITDDFASVIMSKLPLFVGIIVAFGFLLLLIAFRSLLIPAISAIMNLLAAAASFGVVVAFFQWGWGSEWLGLGRAGPVEAFLPVLMLAVLFGLSMDYQVFLVSRMHEEWVNTRDNRRAVIIGQAATGRVITAAAAIMICVFAAFVFGGQRVVAQFGIGLATAVMLDAFVLRTFLVPALMHLFGKANWHLPAFVDRFLPRLAVEPAQEA